MLEVMEERIEVLCELFAQRLDPFGIPGDVYASAAQGFEGSVFELTNRLRAQQLVQDGRRMAIAAMALHERGEGQASALGLQARRGARAIQKGRIFPPASEHALSSHTPAPSGTRVASLFGE